MNTIPTNTTDNPYKKITGEVKVSATYDDNGNVIGSSVLWLGDVVAITRRLIEDADPSVIKVIDDIIYVSSYKAKILEYYPAPYDLYLIKRITHTEVDEV